MSLKASLEKIYKPSEEVTAQYIQGEFLIVPLHFEATDLGGALFSLNETGRAIWEKLDGKNNLKRIALEMSEDFEVSLKEAEKDCLDLIEELLEKGIVVEKTGGEPVA